MDQSSRQSIVNHYQDLRDYVRELIDAIADDQMTLQPIAGITMNHPAWILSHLAPYGPFLAATLRRQSPIDPIELPHSKLSTPGDDPGQYLARQELIDHFCRAYDDAAAALLDADDAIFAEPPPTKRFRGRFPTIRELPIQFLVKHTATHLGQLSAWRRAMGMARV